MERIQALWQAVWREDLGREETALLAMLALVVPFGWVLLLLRSRPARIFLRALRRPTPR